MAPINRFTSIENRKVHYIESTISNPTGTIVLLHGMSFNAETWSSIGAPENINNMNLNYVAVDYPGWGESEKNPEFYPPTLKYSNAAAFIEKLVENLKLERFSLLGVSFSGPFVISYASKHPEHINKIIIVGPVWRDDLSSEASTIRKPVLLCYGERDSVVPIESFAKYSNSIMGSSLRVIREAGHAAYLDNPTEFFRILKEFII